MVRCCVQLVLENCLIYWVIDHLNIALLQKSVHAYPSCRKQYMWCIPATHKIQMVLHYVR